jgi:glycosyltransferase involved in cell wall biosynthesis
LIEQPSDAGRKRRHVLAFTPFFLPGLKGGGPIRSIVEILEALPDSVVVLLVTSDRDLGDTEPYPDLSSRVVPLGRHRIYYWDRARFKSSLRLVRLARSRRFHVLFLNSLWSPSFTMFPWFLRQLRVIRAHQVLLAPRGELSPGALGLKSRKKRLALATWGRLLSRSKPHWQVSSDMEEKDVRRVFPEAITILQPDSSGPEPQEVTESPTAAKFVFVSRIVPKKNLSFLLQAVRFCREPMALDIFGPLEDAEYWRQCSDVISDLPSHVRVRHCGTLPMDKVQQNLAAYDAMLFPTLGENFGFVIPESLSAGCPVVCSPNTPWTTLLESGCGRVLPLERRERWTESIDAIARLTASERTAAKKRAVLAYDEWRRTQNWKTAIELVLAVDHQ